MTHLRLILDVWYDRNDVPIPELEEKLRHLVARGMKEGLLTGESEAEVDEHTVKVEQIND